jgi:hypothetical protein
MIPLIYFLLYVLLGACSDPYLHVMWRLQGFKLCQGAATAGGAVCMHDPVANHLLPRVAVKPGRVLYCKVYVASLVLAEVMVMQVDSYYSPLGGLFKQDSAADAGLGARPSRCWLGLMPDIALRSFTCPACALPATSSPPKSPMHTRAPAAHHFPLYPISFPSFPSDVAGGLGGFFGYKHNRI